MLRDTLQIECTCVPLNPFYLRWLNRYGGFDYQMFQKRQSFEHEQSGITTYEPYISDFESAQGTEILITKDIDRSVTIGAEQLDNVEWNILSYIPESSLVQYYNTWQSRWLNVIVSDIEMKRQTDETLHVVELELKLPRKQLAI